MSPRPPFFDPSKRSPALDGLRGGAILLVLFTHTTVVDPTNWLEHVLLAPMMLGWCGVDLFFVLSGFLITSILLSTRGSGGYFSTFYARRALRILPLYYVLLVFVLLLLPNVPHPKSAEFATQQHTWSYWAFLSNFKNAWEGDFGHPMLAVTWSLAIEEQFYLLWPVVVMLLGERGLRWFCPLLVVGSLAFRWNLATEFDASPVALYTLTPCRLDGLAIGAWLAALVRGGLRVERRTGSLCLFALACYAAVLFSEIFRPMRPPGQPYEYSLFACTFGFTLLSAASGALLLASLTANESSCLARLLRSRLLCSFGKYSFGIYLLHLPVRAVFRDIFFGPGGDTSPLIAFPIVGGSQLLGQVIFYPLAIALCWLTGWVSWKVLERPLLQLKSRFPYR